MGRRRAVSHWHSTGSRHEGAEYIFFMNKRPEEDGVIKCPCVLVCHDGIDKCDGDHVLAVVQNGTCTENFACYLVLDFLLNCQLADELLLRLQQKEVEKKVSLDRSTCMDVRSRLLDLEDDVHSLVTSASELGDGLPTELKARLILSQT